MTHFIALNQVSLSYGLDKLLDHVTFQINAGERICLIGRNGAGKSSLLKIIEGTLSPDSGTIWRKPNTVIARLSQELPINITETVFEFVAGGLHDIGKLLSEYHELIHRVSLQHTHHDLNRLTDLQQCIDQKNGWQYEQKINAILKRLKLTADIKISELSGGFQRRAALAKALITSPDLLLLDEPTNHLDLPSVQWLEEELMHSGVGLIFITHDRALLQRLATQIIELDRGHLTLWPHDYLSFLRHKEEMLHAEVRQNNLFDKKLAEEEKWIRQGIKARRTRNEGRVRALEALRKKRSTRRELQGKVNFNLNQADKSGQLVIEADHITHQYDNRLIIKDFSIRIMRGDRIGLIGSNGSGKTTLLNILLGNLLAQSGTVREGTNLKIAYFDQLREQLDYEKSVADNVAEGNDTLEINGNKRHIISYLSDFLFSPERAMTPVKALSGGECNRLLLASLFSKPANLFVMDEPTNDLDIETLELLEALLSQFQGTLLLVSHDRTFLDNVVTSLLVFEEDGHIQEYIGGYRDWQDQIEKPALKKDISPPKVLHKEASKKSNLILSKEKKELAALVNKIEILETKQTELQHQMAQSDFYKKDPQLIADAMSSLKNIAQELADAYKRWEILDKK